MLKKPGLEELVRELEREYARWEQVYMAGSKDPFWPDGVNANLCRDHILCGKRRIRELYPDAEMPEIYYRPLPQELPAEYMARKEELRSAALRSYTRYISDENFCFIRNHVERIPETDALRGILDALLARADVLKDAVLRGSMFSKSGALAQTRMQHIHVAGVAADLKLLYHGHHTTKFHPLNPCIAKKLCPSRFRGQ